MVKVTCPNCHTEISINSVGRKGYPIGFTNVCKALQDSKGIDGRPNYIRAAEILSNLTGYKVCPGFAHNRITREAKSRQIPREELLAEICNADQEEEA